MMKRMLARTILSLVLAVMGLSATACSQTASEQELTGQTHERHVTGMESQVADH